MRKTYKNTERIRKIQHKTQYDTLMDAEQEDQLVKDVTRRHRRERVGDVDLTTLEHLEKTIFEGVLRGVR